MSSRGGGRGGGRGQGGPNAMQYGRGAYRGGRGCGGGRPTPKPVFAHYSDFSVPSTSYENSGPPKTDDSSIIPFDIASPDILRVKGGEGHQMSMEAYQSDAQPSQF